MAELKYESNVSYYLKHIDAYEKDAKSWEERAKKIIDRYTDKDPETGKRASSFNILWSNVQTLQPALYASAPKPNINQRNIDDDDLGRMAATVMERCVSYYTSQEEFDTVMNQVVLDRLLPGRGIAWERYCPQIGQEAQITDTADGQEEGDEQVKETLYAEDTVTDYVHFEDFGHNVARTWQEVFVIWRKVWLDEDEAKKRFGEKAKALSFEEKLKDGTVRQGLKTSIYEIWDKSKRKVYWLSRSVTGMLDSKEDPLKLRDFFPCPRGLYSTLSNATLIPTPDFILYQDQALELDSLTQRIELITDAVRVAGVYDSTAEGLQKLLTDTAQNKLIAVENWAIFGDKGGLKGVMDLLPMVDIANTLTILYESRDKVKQDIYEITGISDIIRGESNPNETATAQNIKGKFATLRLDSMQKEVARVARDFVRIKTEIICEHFELETIKKLSGVKLLTDAEKAQIQQQMAMQPPPQPGQPPAPPQVPEKVLELMELPTWEQVYALLKDDILRNFVIDIETDSTIKTDQDAERQARVEFVTAAGGYLQQMATVPPQFQNLAAELLIFAVRGFKVGRDMESTIKTELQKIKKASENPPEQADPNAATLQAKQMEIQHSQATEAMRAKMEAESAQMEIADKQQERQLKAEQVQAEMQQNAAKQQSEVELRHAELELKRQQLESDKEIKLAQLAHDRDVAEAELQIKYVELEIEQVRLQIEQSQLGLAERGQALQETESERNAEAAKNEMAGKESEREMAGTHAEAAKGLASVVPAFTQAAKAIGDATAQHGKLIETMVKTNADGHKSVAGAIESLAAAHKSPRKAVRDKDGKIIGSEAG